MIDSSAVLQVALVLFSGTVAGLRFPASKLGFLLKDQTVKTFFQLLGPAVPDAPAQLCCRGVKAEGVPGAGITVFQ